MVNYMFISPFFPCNSSPLQIYVAYGTKFVQNYYFFPEPATLISLSHILSFQLLSNRPSSCKPHCEYGCICEDAGC